ncbi:hypothetical protein E2F47_23545 [Mycobacterium eburneum]|nr:hypothetical protein [Mycobacterium eburneum]TDH48494.1 hypothetical protein E2F47_23545 [Mycobacterium eburneum]
MIGVQTLTIGSATAGALDRKNIPATTYAPTVVQGCQVQPVKVNERVTNIDYALGKFDIFLPPVPAALACKADDHVTDEFGTVYRVIGAKVWYRNGVAHHVTVIAEIPSGLEGED